MFTLNLELCASVRYLLNFRCFKLCGKKIPASIQNEIQITRQYFKVIQGCEPFFIFYKKVVR